MNTSEQANDSRIIRMNEIKAIKLSTISKKRRESVKLAKSIIDNLILPYWNTIADKNNAGLKYILTNPYMEGQDELMKIVKSRYDELVEIEKAKEVESKSETAVAKSSANKSVNTTPKNKKSEIKRKIGDRHPKHPDWVWVEYMPGRFDWRHEKNSAKYGINPQPVIRSVEEILKSTPSEPLTDGEKGLFMLFDSGFKFIEKKTESPLHGYLYLPYSKKTMLVSLVTTSNLFHKLGVTKEEMKQFHV